MKFPIYPYFALLLVSLIYSMLSNKRFLITLLNTFFISGLLAQQPLSLKKAIETATVNYGSIKAKSKYAEASKVNIEEARRENLPNINFGLQQDYGTASGQLGPYYGFNGLASGTAGPTLNHQDWDAAFGALYLTNVNWDFYSFGKAKERVKTAQAVAKRDDKDLQQEIFQHKVKVVAAYLNLVAAHQLTISYQKNVERADTFRRIVKTRVLNGLIAGVDSSQANAEYSSAQIILIRSRDYEEEQNNNLAQLIGLPATQNFILDTFFVSRIPEFLMDTVSIDKHPILQWYKSRMEVSDAQSKYYKTMYYPTFSIAGLYQTRASGFGSSYAVNQGDINKSYFTGINPTRSNYLFGIGVTWNITQPYRLTQQVKSQNLISQGLQEEYNLADQQIKAQLQLSDNKIKNALSVYKEVPAQIHAASDAYTQKSVLYQNGLTTLVDVTQAIYALTRAEADRDIANNNIWQALLLKAAAAGDFSLFESQL